MGQKSCKRSLIEPATDEEKDLRKTATRPDKVEELVRKCFGEGKDVLAKQDVPSFLKKLQELMPIVSDVIREVDAEMLFARFDVDSSESLCSRECYTLITAILNNKINQLSGADDPHIPKKTLEECYIKGAQLGEGGQGVMYLATTKAGDRRCVKQYRRGDPNAPLESIKREFQYMKDFNSPYVARTYELFQDWRFVYIVSEPYFGGDLTKLVQNGSSAAAIMNEMWFCEIFKQILKGLVYIHNVGLIHCDVKPQNVMIADNTDWENPHAILIDFGLGAKLVCNEQGLNGTPGYIPPEVYRRGYWVQKGDIFSAAVTFYSILANDFNPFADTGLLRLGDRDYLREIERRTCGEQLRLDRLRTPSPSSAPKDPLTASTIKVLEQMLDTNIRVRPTAAECLQKDCFTREAGKPQIDLHALQLLRQVPNSDWSDVQQAAFECMLSDWNLSEADRRGLNEMFRRLDVNGDGVIDDREARDGLRKLPGLSDSEIDRIVEALMKGERDNVKYHYFVSRMIGSKRLLEKGVNDLFNRLDANGDGIVSRVELSGLMKACRYDENLSQELMDDLDTDRDERITLEEFTRALKRKRMHGVLDSATNQLSRWSCATCDEVNKASRSQCNNCRERRPADSDERYWTCHKCGEVNKATRTHCNMCKGSAIAMKRQRLE